MKSRQCLSNIVDELTMESDWKIKMNDPNIVNEWRKEIEEEYHDEFIFDSVFSILKGMASPNKPFSNESDLNILTNTLTNNTFVIDSFYNWYSDKNKYEKCIETVNKLETDNKNNEIDPSLYCYVDENKDDEFRKYQWLPSEFEIKRLMTNDEWVIDWKDENYFYWLSQNERYYDYKDRITTKIESYINNLDDEKYSDLYFYIADIFRYFVPYFDDLFRYQLPENVQVIVKLSNIHVTTEEEEKESNDDMDMWHMWHMEGMPYEHIIGIAQYYYNIDNISNLEIEFRRPVSSDFFFEFEDGHYHEIWKRYGIRCGDKLSEHLGSIGLRENTAIVFPNIFQHRMKKFQIENKEKQAHGTMKILTFYLIDPNKPVISTKHINPQQNIWTLDEAKQYKKNLIYTRKCYFQQQSECHERIFDVR